MTRVSSTLVAAGLSAIVMIGLWDAPHGFSAHLDEDFHSMSTNTKPIVSDSGYDVTPLNQDQITALAVDLNEEERRVILNDGTEPAFCGNLTDNKKDGNYICRLCNLPLFKSDSKFNSGTGWPSFFQPFDEDHVGMHVDNSWHMVRTEIVCARCGGHLGHVFDDGPKPTGKRFCVNSVSLTFVDEGKEIPAMPAVASSIKTAYFAGGCFWGVEDRFAQLDGVLDAVSGYQGGDDNDPSYQEVCSGSTGHAESVMLKYDSTIISYQELLVFFFKIHNPTQGNRQGPDVGTQYRSAIYTTDDEQHELAKQFLKDQQREGKWSKKTITTELKRAPKFYKAEEYHQDYHLKNGGHCPIPD